MPRNNKKKRSEGSSGGEDSEMETLTSCDTQEMLTRIWKKLAKLDNIENILETKIPEFERRIEALENASNRTQQNNQDRRKTLIITGLQEKDKEKITDLHNLLADLFKTMKEKNFDFDDAFRLGKPGSGRRPVLLRLLRTRDKFTLFNAKKLLRLEKDGKFANVYINEDKSKEEKEQEYELRRKVKDMQLTDPEFRGSIRGKSLHIRKGNTIVYRFKWENKGNIVEVRI